MLSRIIFGLPFRVWRLARTKTAFMDRALARVRDLKTA